MHSDLAGAAPAQPGDQREGEEYLFVIAAYSAGPESDAASVVAQLRTILPEADIRRGDQQDWLFIVATRIDHEKIRAVLKEILAKQGEEP